MNSGFMKLFFFSFLIVACIYAFLASCTGIFYRKKAVGQLSGNELRIKQGAANIDDRVSVFFRTFFLSVFTYQVYVLALIMSGSMYLWFFLLER